MIHPCPGNRGLAHGLPKELSPAAATLRPMVSWHDEAVDELRICIVILCHNMSYYVIICHDMPYCVILCHNWLIIYSHNHSHRITVILLVGWRLVIFNSTVTKFGWSQLSSCRCCVPGHGWQDLRATKRDISLKPLVRFIAIYSIKKKHRKVKSY